jgi:ribosomal protein L40E
VNRICRKCGSEDLRFIGYIPLDTPRWEDQSEIIWKFTCKRCGAMSAYGEYERTTFNRHHLKRAIALDNTL